MKYEFREDEEVAHIDNLPHKLTVRRPRYVHIELPGKKKKIRRLKGIICYWWEGKSLRENIFHSEKLVPWHFAQQGQEAAEQWLKDMGAKKYQE